MKLLLDECIDQRLAREIIGYEVETVPGRGWANLKNGQLLTVAQNEFDVFVTVDHSLPYQQNLPKFNIAVVVLRASTNRLVDLKPLIPKLLEALSTAEVGKAIIIGE